jgi:hypothetical protein
MYIPQVGDKYLNKYENQNVVWTVEHVTGNEKAFPVADNDRAVTLKNEKKGMLGTSTITHRTFPLALLDKYYFKLKTV